MKNKMYNFVFRGTTVDSRSLPRMTGSKLTLRRQPPSQTSSTNNSSADESTGPSAAYRKIVSRKSQLQQRAQSPPILRGACASPTNSESESANELAQQLKRLGQYLEQKEDKTGDDSEVDEYLMNIRKALYKK